MRIDEFGVCLHETDLVLVDGKMKLVSEIEDSSKLTWFDIVIPIIGSETL